METFKHCAVIAAACFATAIVTVAGYDAGQAVGRWILKRFGV